MSRIKLKNKNVVDFRIRPNYTIHTEEQKVKYYEKETGVDLLPCIRFHILRPKERLQH